MPRFKSVLWGECKANTELFKLFLFSMTSNTATLQKKSLKIHDFTTQECERFLPPFQILYLNVYTLHNLSSGKNSYPHYKYLYQWYLHLCYYFIIIQRNQGRVKLLISTAIENKSCSGGILQRVESWFHSDWKFSKGMFFHRKMLIHQNQRI